jgi:hypothetical protein
MFHQDDVLYVEERITDGDTANIWGNDVVIAVKGVIIRRKALAKTWDKHRVCDSQIKVTNSPSL